MPGAGMSLGGCLAHEFVHSWNGKYRRPCRFDHAYYEEPMETDLLWVMKGLRIIWARAGRAQWLVERGAVSRVPRQHCSGVGPGRPGRTWRPLLDTASGVSGVGGGRGGGWASWRRGADYYDEGDLVWLEVATIIHRETQGKKSIDDFCHAFHGGANQGPEVKTYTFEQL